MQSNNRTWYLMARSLSNESTAEEQEELYSLLYNNHALQQQFEALSLLWNETSLKQAEVTTPETAQKNISRILQLAAATDILEDTNVGSITRKRRRLVKRTAFFLLLFLLAFGGIAWWHNKSAPTEDKNIAQVIVAQKGSRSRTILPDGSTVWLNAGSRIYYEGNFNGPLREVRLDGEAFFDVVKNPARPFIVHTSGIDIKVLGTAFNVKSYATDETVETTLIRGLVKVTREHDAKNAVIFLHPNEKLTLQKAGPAGESIPVKKADAKTPETFTGYHISKLDAAIPKEEQIETAWVYNHLVFRGDSFEELAKKLERWYNVQIEFSDEAVKKLNFNGSFDNETVEQAFTALKAAVPFNFKINDHEIFISSSK